MIKIQPFHLLLAGLFFFAIGLLANVIYSSGEIFALMRLFMGISFFSAFFLALRSHQFAPEHRIYLKVFLILLVYVAILAIPNYMRFYWLQGMRVRIALEVAYYSMFAFGLVVLTLDYQRIVLLVKILLVGSVAMFLLCIPRMDAAAVIFEERRRLANDAAFAEAGGVGAYQAQMSMAYIYLSSFLLIFALRIKPYWQMLAASSLAFVLITAFYYSKRATLLDLLATMALFIVVHGFLTGRFGGLRKFQFIAFGALGVLAVGLGVQFFGGGADILFERLVRRFDEFRAPDYQLQEFGRIREVQMWFAQASPLNKLLGAGPLGFHRSGATDNVTTGLHIGWAKLFVKGGPVLVFFVAWIFWRNFTCAWRHRHRPSAIIGLSLPPLFATSMLHSSVFDVVPAGFVVAFALFLYPALFSLENRGLAPQKGDLTFKGKQARTEHREGRAAPLPPPRRLPRPMAARSRFRA